MKGKLILFTAVIMCISCNYTSTNTKNDKIATKNTDEIHFAKGFTIQRFAEYTVIEVRNPWDTNRILETYILVKREKELPKNLPQGSIVRIPVERVATCSSIFAGEYLRLGKIDKIIAVSEPEYVDIPEIKDGLKSGKIADLGITVSLNTEKLLASKPDILVISPFEESMHDRFKNLGIVVVKDASYMEESPLGRAEWIKFEAAFLDKDSLARVIYQKIEKSYLDLKKMAAKTNTRPTVLTEKKFGDTWYIAGGYSYMGNFISDAGGNYLWKELKHSGSIPLSFENVYSKAIHTQFWLIKYNNTQFDLTYKQLGEEYELYKNFSAYKNRKIFAVNSGNTLFYEEGPMEPDVVLADLIKIFHPEVLPEHTTKYYKSLK